MLLLIIWLRIILKLLTEVNTGIRLGGVIALKMDVKLNLIRIQANWSLNAKIKVN